MINIANLVKNKEFYYKALYDNLKELLPTEDARFLATSLVEKLTFEELNAFLLSPIVVINGEHCQRVDNDFIKRQLLKQGNYEALSNLNKAKIIICNCEDISVIGLDVVYLFGNKIRLISPTELAQYKNDVFLAKDNKVLFSLNVAYKMSIGNAFKNVINNVFDRVVDTRMLNISPSTIIECDSKSRPFQVKREFVKSVDGNTYTIYNPTKTSSKDTYSTFDQKDST